MIKFENVEVVGWEHAIRGMRNPKNSWEMSDSELCKGADGFEDCHVNAAGVCPRHEDFRHDIFCVGAKDLDLMTRLRNAGTDHRKFMRMIVVYVDITAPLYWWKEFDTYKVGTVANSCSTMHKIHAKPFEMEDFSHEHLIGVQGSRDDWWYDVDFGEWWSGEDILAQTVYILNFYRQKFIDTKDKKYWWQMIQLLPTSYNQKRTVMLNYEVLANIYKPGSRLHHKLDEWNVDCDGSFCKWIESLPYSELITGK